MGYDEERHAVRHRVARLHRRCVEIFGLDGGEELRLALETELVQARRADYLLGKRDGFETARKVGTGGAPPPEQAPDPDRTPQHPTDWVGPRRK